jgi:hypothetical protein
MVAGIVDGEWLSRNPSIVGLPCRMPVNKLKP